VLVAEVGRSGAAPLRSCEGGGRGLRNDYLEKLATASASVL